MKPDRLHVIRGNALALPLADETVDLICTSPPYFALRSYQDGGEHYDGQVGSEATPQEFLEALWAATREMVRVLKPSGSIWVNLGDSFSSGQRFDRGFTAQDAAWLAGVIDSDGSVSIRVDNGGRSHIAWTRVGQMRPEVVRRIGELTGTGKVWQDNRGVWNWNAAAQQARWVLERIWPWLRIKQRQALAAIDLMAQKESRGRRGTWAMLTDDDIRRRELIRQAVLAWNRGEEFSDYEPPPAALVDLPRDAQFIPAKSLIGIPWRYALGCIDQLGLILRAEVIWAKPNGLPESVTDRVRRSHEQWFHFVKQPRYYSAVDEIREKTGRESDPATYARSLGKSWHDHDADETRGMHATPNKVSGLTNPLGKLPGSVWTIPTEPLTVPDHLGVDHFAAFPSEWPKRIIRGWSPPGICVECGEGRRPMSVTDLGRKERDTPAYGAGNHGTGGSTLGSRGPTAVITGYACACPEPTAPTRPAVCLDPFGGTGTTAHVAYALGRIGISVDLSADYCRIAADRDVLAGRVAKVLGKPKPPPVPREQGSLFDDEGAA